MVEISSQDLALDNTEASLNDMSMEQKVDEILRLLKVQKIESTLDIKALQSENQKLKLHVRESEGLITKLSSKVTLLEAKLEKVEMHSMKKNVVVYNIPKEMGENLHQKVEDFLARNLQIPQEQLFSKDNPAAPIRIDVTHRIGHKERKPRPVVVSFVTQQAKDVVLSHLI